MGVVSVCVVCESVFVCVCGVCVLSVEFVFVSMLGVCLWSV